MLLGAQHLSSRQTFKTSTPTWPGRDTTAKSTRQKLFSADLIANAVCHHINRNNTGESFQRQLRNSRRVTNSVATLPLYWEFTDGPMCHESEAISRGYTSAHDRGAASWAIPLQATVETSTAPRCLDQGRGGRHPRTPHRGALYLCVALDGLCPQLTSITDDDPADPTGRPGGPSRTGGCVDHFAATAADIGSQAGPLGDQTSTGATATSALTQGRNFSTGRGERFKGAALLTEIRIAVAFGSLLSPLSLTCGGINGSRSPGRSRRTWHILGQGEDTTGHRHLFAVVLQSVDGGADAQPAITGELCVEMRSR
jgi:hypothetical protein